MTTYCETDRGIESVTVGLASTFRVQTVVFESYDFDHRPTGSRVVMPAWFAMPSESRHVIAYGAGPTDAVAQLDKILSAPGEPRPSTTRAGLK